MAAARKRGGNDRRHSTTNAQRLRRPDAAAGGAHVRHGDDARPHLRDRAGRASPPRGVLRDPASDGQGTSHRRTLPLACWQLGAPPRASVGQHAHADRACRDFSPRREVVRRSGFSRDGLYRDRSSRLEPRLRQGKLSPAQGGESRCSEIHCDPRNARKQRCTVHRRARRADALHALHTMPWLAAGCQVRLGSHSASHSDDQPIHVRVGAFNAIPLPCSPAPCGGCPLAFRAGPLPNRLAHAWCARDCRGGTRTRDDLMDRSRRRRRPIARQSFRRAGSFPYETHRQIPTCQSGDQGTENGRGGWNGRTRQAAADRRCESARISLASKWKSSVRRDCPSRRSRPGA
ncbi:hypothetical protein FHR56_003152 [Xanthomonas sacchari]|nr:hypothetical protein [Xanthomonas sp. F10]